jgi:hypothetical protein
MIGSSGLGLKCRVKAQTEPKLSRAEEVCKRRPFSQKDRSVCVIATSS